MAGSPHLRPLAEAELVVEAAKVPAAGLSATGFRAGWVHGQEHPNGFVRELWWTHPDGVEFATLAILPEGPVLAFDSLCADGTVVTTSTPRPPLQPWMLEGCWEKSVVDRPLDQLLVDHRARVAAHGGPVVPHADRALAVAIEVRVEELILSADLPSARLGVGVLVGLAIAAAAGLSAAFGVDPYVAGVAAGVGGLVILGAWFGRSGPVRRSAEEIVASGETRIEIESRTTGRVAAR